MFLIQSILCLVSVVGASFYLRTLTFMFTSENYPCDRACPGSHMALSTLFIIASCILHTMRVESDEAQEVEFTDTLFP